MKLISPRNPEDDHTRSTLDTIEVTVPWLRELTLPPFQRPLKPNSPKVRECGQFIVGNGGVIPGVITLGRLPRDPKIYTVDGQHRFHGFELSGLEVGYADVRYYFGQTMTDLANEYVRLNSALVRLRPDDLLRAMEGETPALQKIRRKCPFVGYGQARRSGSSVVLSMATFLRIWTGSRGECPAVTINTIMTVGMMSDEETDAAIEFLTLCYAAWQADREYARLWTSLNLLILAWLYRRIVLNDQTSTSRSTRFTKEDFRRGLSALSGETSYLEYLGGHNVAERDRSPAYSRIKKVFGRRYTSEHPGRKPSFPQPAWTHA